MFSPLEHSIVGKARERDSSRSTTIILRENAWRRRGMDGVNLWWGGKGCFTCSADSRRPLMRLRKRTRAWSSGSCWSDLWSKLCRRIGSRRWWSLSAVTIWGYDERIKTLVTDEISLGIMSLTVGNLLPWPWLMRQFAWFQVIGKSQSPGWQFLLWSSGISSNTRPYEYRGMTVPDVLVSGHHENIRQWRSIEFEKDLRTSADLLTTTNWQQKNDDVGTN